MPLDVDRLQKPVRKLRKFMKKTPRRPTPDEVHDLRTNTRRVEASVEALSLDSKRVGERLLKDLARVRKRAGKVRDMDVLTGFASNVHPKGEQDCVVQLLERLGARRGKYAKRLYTEVRQYGPKLRKRLKRIAARFDKLAQAQDKSSGDRNAAASEVAASALRLSTELATPSRLGRTNLHPYRLKVKELRNVLQMAQRANDDPFVKSLGEVKDAIGEWHDWEELISIAKDALDHGPKCQLLRDLKGNSRVKYEHALRLTENMRKKYLGPSKRRTPRSSGRVNGLAEPVQAATAVIAA